MQSDETTSLDTTATSDSGCKWEYRCIFCSKTFSSGRALGGHQNAHRFETRESKRTHHVRLPRQQQDTSNSSAVVVVQSAASQMNNVRPQNPSHVRPTAGNVGAPLIRPGWSNGQQGRRHLGFGAGPAGIMPSMGTAMHNYYQAASYPMPPVQERDHNLQEWQNLIARAGQGMQSETSRIGSSAAVNGVDQDGVAEVDLELKLYF